MIPVTGLLIIAYCVSTFPPYEWVDALGDYDFNNITREIYDGVGQVLALYNLIVFIIETALFVVCYYIYYIASVLLPKLMKHIAVKRKSSRSLSKN
ncbi:hypothetical protein FACS1894218_3370 [Bacilli bacterium]|nr:hypothetical protein FACS1894218_3370 [Bacilli bacterium]